MKSTRFSLLIMMIFLGGALASNRDRNSKVSNGNTKSHRHRAPAAGPYTPDWNSLDTRPIPQWYDDAKFGIFIHWGVYSVPAWAPVGTYAEWYWHDLNQAGSATQAFHNATYGAAFKYQDFNQWFTAELFNATQWADILKRSGAQYVVPTSKHHEGFTLWPSKQSWNWNVVDLKPHRDLLQELRKAVVAAGMHFGLYYSLYEWYHPLYLKNPPEYVTEIMLPQLYDVVTNYQPELIFSDGDWDHNSTFWQTPTFVAWLYNSSPVKDTVVVNDRWGSDTGGVHGGYFTPEYDSKVYLNHKWEENSGIDIHSFGYNRNTPADKYYTAEQLLNLLLRCVSNNGNLLLDIGPSSDGRIPNIMQFVLEDMGAWLTVNGEAVYGTRIWREQQEGTIDNTTLRYTQNPNTGDVYAHSLVWPGPKLVLQHPIPQATTQVTMLGVPGILKWTAVSGGGMAIEVPALTPSTLPCKYIWVFKLANVK